MNTLSLKSKAVLKASVDKYLANYVKRVEESGGVIIDIASVRNAYEFIVVNNIKVTDIFSATYYKWGVVEENGIAVKMFSLFNELGDMNVRTRELERIWFDKDEKSLAILGQWLNNSDTFAESVGTMNAKGKVVIGVACKALQDAWRASYEGVVLNLASVDEGYVAKGNVYRYFSLVYRQSSSTDINTWGKDVLNNAANARKPVEGAANIWNKTTFITDGSSIDAASSSSITSIIGTNKNTSVQTNLKLTLGAARERTDAGNVIYLNTGRAYIAESWVINNSTEDVAKALALKLEQSY